MKRYVAAAKAGYDSPQESCFMADDWIRFSPVRRAAYELGSYFWRKGDPLPQEILYLGRGDNRAAFDCAGVGIYEVSFEYPGVVIRLRDAA